jgi:multiple sugar transport system substrate-binding protein
MVQWRKLNWFGAALALYLWIGGADRTAFAAASQSTIRIVWAECDPAAFLTELATQFTLETGIAVEIVKYPWPEFQSQVKEIWKSKNDSVDLIIGDSQWLGLAVTQGHYVDLTDFVKSVKNQFSDQSIEFFAEYPRGSGRYYAVPCENNALGFAYRKDLLEDAAEMAAFKAKYGRDLAVPKTWSEFRDIAEFFTRPDSGLYGAALIYGSDYDYITMSFQPFLWSYGGDWCDSNNQVEGVVNSPEAVQGLTFLIDLLKFNPPNAANFWYESTEASFMKGESVMCMDWFGYMAKFNSDANPHKNQTGYFMIPGETKRFSSLGGQGISLSSYSKKADLAKQFLAWFVKDENQLKWAKLGGLSSNKTVSASADFLNAQPFNEAYSSTLPFVKDFYNVPAYSDLLAVSQLNLHAALEGKLTPKAALDAIAKEHTRILSQSSNAKGWELY